MSMLDRARVGTTECAWEELVVFYEPFVSKVLTIMGLRGVDLEDVQQEVFFQLWKGLPNYKRDPKRARFRTWFARLIRNVALNFHRSQRRRPVGPSVDEGNPKLSSVLSMDPEIEAKVADEWERYVVDLALVRVREMFSGHAVTVFEMSLGGRPVEEIVGELNIRTDTVYVLKNRVKTALIKEIRRIQDELEPFDQEAAE